MHLPYQYTTFQIIQHYAMFSALLIAAIYTIRGQSKAIYAIWYVYSFFFILFFGLGISAHQHGVAIPKLCGTHADTCESIYNQLTRLEDELLYIFVFVALTVGPQLMTYILSGLSGSASSPRFVSVVQKAGTWSLIKFTAGLAGLLTAAPLASWLTGHTYFDVTDFIPPLVYLFAAFGFAWLQFNVFEAPLEPRRWWALLRSIHAFCTRNVKIEEAD